MIPPSPPHQQPPPTVEDHRYGLPPLQPIQVPAQTPSRQNPTPAVEDHRYGFVPPQPIQQAATPIPHQAPTQNSGLIQLAPPALPPSPSNLVLDDHGVSDSGSEGEAALQPEIEIDEQSDDEDERQAHTLLRAALVPDPVPAPPAVTPPPRAVQTSLVPAPVQAPPTITQTANNFVVRTLKV